MAATTEDRWPVPDIDAVEVAFPVNVLDWMPSRQQIPDEFRFIRGKSEWCEVTSAWFFQGLNPDVKFYPRDGVDRDKALTAISAVLGSFAPKHEHKEEAVAFLLDQWFSKVKNWKKKS